MKLKNTSARGHWIGDVLIAPGEVKEVAEMWRGAYNQAELEEVVDAPEPVESEPTEEEAAPKKRGRPAKVSQDADAA